MLESVVFPAQPLHIEMGILPVVTEVMGIRVKRNLNKKSGFWILLSAEILVGHSRF